MRKAWWCVGALALAGCPDPDKDVVDTDSVDDTEDEVVGHDSDTDDTVIDSDTDLPIDSDTDLPIDSDTDLPIDSDTDLPIDSDTDQPLGLADLALDDLRITEVMVSPDACTSANGQYVEVVYEGDARADLQGLIIVGRQGSSTPIGHLVVDPGDRVVLGRGAGLCASWGRPADAAYGSLLFSGTSELVKIRTSSGLVFDQVDLVGRPATPGVAWSQDELTEDWCDATSTIGASDDLGTPGDANDPCLTADTDTDETGLPDETDTDTTGETDTDTTGETDTDTTGETDTDTVDTDTDAVDTDTDAVDTDTDTVDTDTDTVDTDTDVELPPLTTAELAPGDLRITEVSAWAQLCSTDAGRFVEVRNTTSREIDLTGIRFGADGASASFPSGQPLSVQAIVPPGGLALFLRTSQAFTSCWGEPTVPFVPTLVPLAAASDRVWLARPDGTVIAEVAWPATTGALVQGHTKERDDADAWCDADVQVNLKDHGSPGVENVACDARVDPDTDVVHTDETGVDSDTDVIVETGVDTDPDVALAVTDLASGDLLISEVMPAPGACDDADGSEYIELIYRGAAEADLHGLRIVTNGQPFDLLRHLHVTQGQRVVLARDKAAFTACYGFAPDAGTGIALLDTAATVEIRAVAPGISRRLDDTPPITLFGASLERDDTTFSAWCAATDPIGGTTDLGTPGATNGTCLVIGNDTAREDTAVDETWVPRTLAEHLVITEVYAKNSDPNLSWIEVSNPGPAPVPLDGWFLAQYANGQRYGLSILKIPLQRTETLAAGESWWVGSKNATSATWLAVMGVVPDQLDPSLSTDGDDAWVLEYHGVAIDAFGEVGIDGDGTDWAYGETVAQRHDDVRRPRARWRSDEWTLSSDLASATPGTHTFSTPPDSDTATPAPGAPLRISDVAVGDLVISEFLADPAACPDADAEFVELHWKGAEPLDLFGLTAKIGVISSTVTESVVVQPGDRVVVARDAAGFQACYGLAADVQLDIALKATGDVTRILDNTGAILDTVDWSAWTITPGVSWRRSDGDATWCLASGAIGSTVDQGTPGAANGTCPP